MGIQFKKLKKNDFPTDPYQLNQGQVRGNKNIFKVGLKGVFFYFSNLGRYFTNHLLESIHVW